MHKKMRARRMGVTLEYVESVDTGRCWICDKQDNNLHMDHCHTTGKFRGLLCSQCNTALGLFYDNPVAIRRAANFVELRHLKKENESK